TRIDRLRLFIDYLDDCGLTSLSELTAQELTNYTVTLVGYNSKSVAAVLTVLRTFLKFLYLKGYHPKDLSSDVPSVKNSYYPSIPSAWKSDSVKRMLDCVDRGNPTGKRDYAILLIVTRLGMRVQDLKEIKLSNLKWEARKIEIVQHKTKQAVSYPLLDDIGWAIIDYLKNGRPQTTSPHLFVRHNAPFEAFGTHANLHNIITKYTRLAGIELPRGSKRGMHSLRHTLASVLLEQHTPLPVISEILGHMSVLATSVYLKIDLEGLRKCALDPEEVFNYADN
ncbi:MAG: site-specific integrase, partial [Bacillota bacterium]|nr:site-specific integrase [Bacillota bacterium]